eukprot:301525_1
MPQWIDSVDLSWLNVLKYYDEQSAHDLWDTVNSSDAFGRSKATQRAILCKDSRYQIAYLSNIVRESIHIWTFKIQNLNSIMASHECIIQIGLFE